ncbi:MAG: protease modulator HflC [Ruminococcaceae bacterium]|nr:protease modulator HflC [Oscillospiraceae bacterium]
MKKGWVTVLVIALIAVMVGSGAFYVVAENEHACVMRFNKIEKITSKAGLYFKIPFVDEIMSFPNTVMLYDIPESEVLTADKKNMTVDSYITWKIADPQVFYQTLGTITEAEIRLDALTYNALKNLMGTLEQNDIINEEDASERNDIYFGITSDVADVATTYGIEVLDVKVKRLDLPEDNEQAVYARMISDRNQIAEKYTADGEYEASIIRNDVDKQVNIIVSNAQAQAAKLEAEGEAEYMQMLADAYDSEEKKDFYEFTLGLDALKASLDAEQNTKTVIIDGSSLLGQLLLGPQE